MSQAGGVLLLEAVRASGLDRELSAVLSPWRTPLAVHDPAKVLVDLAVTLAVGGDCLRMWRCCAPPPGVWAGGFRSAGVPHGRGAGRRRTAGAGRDQPFEINQAWCLAVAIACDLLAWLRLLCLTGDLARAEPKTLRYRLLHVAARLVRGQRKPKIRIPASCPWAEQLHAALTSALTLPLTRPA